MERSETEFRMPEIIESYTEIIRQKGLTAKQSAKAAKIIYEMLFIEPASPGKRWFNHDAAEAFVPALQLMGWKWFKALLRDHTPTMVDVEEQDAQVTYCPRCSQPTTRVEIIYPGEWGEKESKAAAWMCPHCRYVFADSDIDYIQKG